MGRRPESVAFTDPLRRLACFEQARRIRDWRPPDIIQHLKMSPTAKTHFEWLAHRQAPSDTYLGRILALEPTAQTVYDLPLWRLLEDDLISESEVSHLVARFRKDLPSYESVIPQRQYRRETEKRYPPIRSRTTGGQVAIRTDLVAFIETLALARLAESAGNWGEFEECVKQLFVVLPIIGKTDWFRLESKRLFKTLLALYFRIPGDRRSFHPDPRIVLGQIQQTNFTLSESRWMVSQYERHHVADPIVLGALDPRLRDMDDLLDRYEMHDLDDTIGYWRTNLGRNGGFRNYANHYITILCGWRVPRHCWEPILGLSPCDFDKWISGDLPPLREHKEAITSLIRLAGRFEDLGLSYEEREAWFLSHLQGSKLRPIDLLATGQRDEVIEYAYQAFAAHSPRSNQAVWCVDQGVRP